jgi:hypothetical protein
MGAKATFDTVNKLIVLDVVAPVSSRVAVDTQVDLYSDAKEDWQADAFAAFVFPFTTIGGNELGGGLEAGDYYFLRTDLGWRIRPFEQSHTLTITGNLYPIDAADDLIVPTSTSVTVAAIFERSQLTQTVQDQIDATASAVWQVPVDGVTSGSFGEVMRTQAFGIVVYFDGDTGTAQTAYPFGRHRYPIDNFADTFTVANREGLSIVHMQSQGVIEATDDASGFIIEGHNMLKVQCEVSAGALTTNTKFMELYLRNAVLNGWTTHVDCLLENVSNFQGIARNCILNPGTITLTGGQNSHFNDCYSGRPGELTPIIDMDGKSVDLGIRAYAGGIKIDNNTAANNISIDLISGQIILDATCTGGTIVCRGVGKLTDNSAGSTVIDEMNAGGSSLSAAQEARLREIHQILGLEAGAPMVQTVSTRVAASVTQTIIGDPDVSMTFTRT